MVDVGVREQHAVNFSRVDRQLLIDKDIGSLLHAAVDQNMFSLRFQKSAAPRHLVGGAQKSYLHRIITHLSAPRISRSSAEPNSIRFSSPRNAANGNFNAILQSAIQQTRVGIVLCETLSQPPGAMGSVAIHAAAATGIVSADIHAFGATAALALVAIGRGQNHFPGDPRKPPGVNAPRLCYLVRANALP